MEKSHERHAAETEPEPAEKIPAVHRIVDVIATAEIGHGHTFVSVIVA